MAEENNLVIGATIDVDQLKAGLQTSVEEIRSTTQTIGWPAILSEPSADEIQLNNSASFKRMLKGMRQEFLGGRA